MPNNKKKNVMDEAIISKEKYDRLLQENESLKKENASIKKLINSKRFRMAEKVANTYNAFFPEGTFRRKAFGVAIKPTKSIIKYNSERLSKKLSQIVSSYDKIIVMHSIVWNAPLKQRPHHLAKCLANNKDVVVIYFEPDEHVKKFRKISKNLYTVNSWNAIINLATSASQRKFFFFNNVSNIDYDNIELVKNKGYEIVYEYIDEFDEDVAGVLVNQMENWKRLPELKPYLVLASATKLYNEAKKHFRECEVLLSKNAVNVEDFNYNNFINKDIPSDLTKILENNKPIVGYYGALAHWLDYDLISEVAKNNQDYNFVLMGVNYQNALGKLNQSINNIYYLGPKKYNELPYYSSHFNVAIIPFQTGQIAKGTSPVKLFEYMAMGLPTVGTRDLDECRGYEYVYLAKNVEDFSKLLRKAIIEHAKDNVRRTLLLQAEKNSWQSRADDIMKALDN